MIHDELVSFETAKLAKEKGFPQDECGVNIPYYAWDGLRKIHSQVSSFAWYDDEYNHDDLFLAPTQSLLQRWLREEKWVDIEITVAYAFNIDRFYRRYDCQIKSTREGEPIFVVGAVLSYEEAMDAGLKFALENLV